MSTELQEILREFAEEFPPEKYWEIATKIRAEYRWATDPLGLMPWLSLAEWRWRVADALEAIARWIAPGTGQ